MCNLIRAHVIKPSSTVTQVRAEINGNFVSGHVSALKCVIIAVPALCLLSRIFLMHVLLHSE